MSTTRFDFTPFVPDETALEQSDLPDKAMELVRAAASLKGGFSLISMETITCHMAVINSYYSNLIEGHATLPHEVRAAQQGDFSEDPAKRDLQLESLAHIEVQHWLRQQHFMLDQLFAPETIQLIHQRFYEQVPENLWVVRNPDTGKEEKLVPGQWRHRGVRVGAHIPPEHSRIPDLMQSFGEIYSGLQFRGDRRIIAVLAAHHRFAWIHPFLDGNGRVGRLLTDAALRAIGFESYGLWCLSRGLARQSQSYRTMLAGADKARQGDYDGRGALTEQGLMQFCDYMLDTALDQVQYMADLLKLDKMRERLRAYVRARADARVPGIEGELHESAALVLYQAFVDGELARADALRLTGMSERSGRRVLKQLKEDGLLSETSSRSPLRWEVPQHAEPWYFPQLAPGY